MSGPTEGKMSSRRESPSIPRRWRWGKGSLAAPESIKAGTIGVEAERGKAAAHRDSKKKETARERLPGRRRRAIQTGLRSDDDDRTPVTRFAHAVGRRNGGVRLAVAHDADTVGGDAVGDQRLANRVGASVRKSEVVPRGACQIGVSVDLDVRRAVLRRICRGVTDDPAGSGRQPRLVELEIDGEVLRSRGCRNRRRRRRRRRERDLKVGDAACDADAELSAETER